MISHKISFQELNLSKEDIFAEMGYVNIKPDPYVIEIIDRLYPTIQKEITPQYAFSIHKGDVFPTRIEIEGNIVLETGDTISSLMKNAGSIAFFVATADIGFERLMNQIKEEGDLMQTYILNVIGSSIAEKTGDVMEAHLKQEIHGLRHTHRFSPGYCGWNLAEQKKIFSLLRGNPCGIELSEVYLMNPLKSISGIVGIGEHVSQKLYGCDVCELETCYKRKQKK